MRKFMDNATEKNYSCIGNNAQITTKENRGYYMGVLTYRNEIIKALGKMLDFEMKKDKCLLIVFKVS